MKKKIISTLLILTMLVSLSACGNSGVSEKGVDVVKERGKLKVGVKADIPKFSILSTKTGDYEGFEDDLAYEIAGEIFGVSAKQAKKDKLVSFQGVTAKTRGPLLENGELDMIIATFTITEQRKETYNFSAPYFTDAAGLLVNNDSGIKSIKDLDKKIIGVAQSSTTKEGFKSYVKEHDLDVEPEFQEFDGYPSMAQALATKQIDCMSVDRAILGGYVNDSNHLLDDRFAEQEYGIAIAKKNTQLADLTNKKIDDMLQDGTIKELLKKWDIS